MKRLPYLLALAVLCCACGEDESTPTQDFLLKSFTLLVGEDIYHAEIDQEKHTVRIGGIEYSSVISGVDYKLAEGATIAPDPASMVNNWPENYVFTVTRDGQHVEYRIYLSAYVSHWPEQDGEVIFYDEFDGNSLNMEYWDYVPYGTAAWQTYMSGSPDQSFVENGKLILEIESVNGKVFTGGVKTQGKKWFKNCRIDISARFVDDAASIGQAIWLMPEPAFQRYPGWPDGGEIDIMEHNYIHDYVTQTLHSHYIDIYSEQFSGKVAYAGYNADGFNTYSVEMTDEQITFFTNNVETGSYTNLHLPNETEVKQWPFSGQYYLILSTGPAGPNVNIPATDLPSRMEVEYVRVTRLN